MNTESFIASRNDEAVFDNRNKSYGAYSIRKSYASSLTKGWGGSLLVAGFFVAIIQAVLMMKPEMVKPNIRIKPPIDLLRDFKIIPEKPTELPKHEVKQSQGFPTTVVTHDVAETPFTEGNIPATDTEQGNIGNSAPTDGVGIPVVASSAPPIAEVPKIVDRAEVMPEFEGGEKAMYRFLRRHLRYPHTDQQGTVYVRFIIDITGTVTGVEIFRGVSGLLDREASRVISQMPKWKPGTQHGDPVNVRMVLPIRFEMEKQ